MQDVDGWLEETGIAAHDVGDAHAYLYVPGQLVVAQEDADTVREDLQRRGLLGDGRTTSQARPARSPFDGTTMRRLGRLLGRDRLADLLQVRQDRLESDDGNGDLPRPGQDPAADEDLGELGLVRLHLSDPSAVPKLVASYRAEGLRVAPNHVIHWEPLWRGAPGTLPTPADEASAPDEGTADGPSVVVLDTGIQDGWDADPWFASRVSGVGPDGLEVTDHDGDGELDLQAGHGTFIASLVAAGCPAARIHPRRVLNSSGLTSDADLARAILAVAKLEPDLLVLSLGCYAADDVPPPAITAALRRLPSRTVVVAAAGNASQTRVFWPAALKTVVAVGAHDAGAPAGRASFSNHGWWVDACADGVDVHAKFVRWDGGLDGLQPGEHAFSGFAVWSGTSFAAPIVAAALAQHMVDHGCSAHEAVRARVRGAGLPSLPGLGVRVD